MISLIVAMSKNNVIGVDNSLPWHLSEDLKFFKKTTTGKVVIMGRNCYESIGHPLPNRTNVVITRDTSFNVEGCYVYNSVATVLDEYFTHTEPNEEIMIAGGAIVYKQFLPHADRLYVTYIDHEFEGDCVFPKIDMKEWKLISNEKGIKNEENPYNYYFRVYERK